MFESRISLVLGDLVHVLNNWVIVLLFNSKKYIFLNGLFW